MKTYVGIDVSKLSLSLAIPFGLVPITYQWGKTGFSQSISRAGDAHLRSLLYMATWSAIRYNQPCKELYQRLKAAGKASKLALIAVANKLLRQAFAVVKFNEDFDPNYQPILRLSA